MYTTDLVDNVYNSLQACHIDWSYTSCYFEKKLDKNIWLAIYLVFTVKPVLRGHLWDKENMAS
jgi:hypothetical protein